jgi:hypothetical protein
LNGRALRQNTHTVYRYWGICQVNHPGSIASKIALRHFGDLMTSKYKAPEDQVLNQNQALNHKGGSYDRTIWPKTKCACPLAQKKEVHFGSAVAAVLYPHSLC